MEDFKIKPLTKEQIIISIDRLTRFKNTEIKYLRVYKDIIISNLIYPKYKKCELDKKDYSELTNLAQKIINYSLEKLNLLSSRNFIINQRLFDYENSIFRLSDETKKLLSNKINYSDAIKLITDGAPINLKWLKTLETAEDIKVSRENYSLHFPIEKIIITEGITEEILLPEFAKFCGLDFDKKGIHILSAGGKNQVVKLFYRLAETLKIPIFVLLDNDAKENFNEILPRLRPCDKIHLLKCGEFEDLLPLSLVQKTLNYTFENISIISEESLRQDLPMVKILEELFKNRGLHEFKKSEFAEIVKKNISCADDVSDEIKDIIDELNSCSDLTKIKKLQ